MLALLVVLTTGLTTVLAQPAPAATSRIDFQGRALLVLSDADMLASAYVNGKLGPSSNTDSLSLIALGAAPDQLKAKVLPMSNSVAGPPVAVATSPDGRFAFVVETFQPRPAGKEDAVFADLAPGSKMRVIDLTDLANPRTVQAVDTPLRPDSVSVSSDGRWVVIAIHPQGGGAQNPLAFYPFADGQLGRAQTPVVPRWRAGERLIHAEFHPNQAVIGLVNESRGELAFVRMDTSAPTVQLTPWGNIVQTEKSPYMVRFTPDGRHAISNALYWGADVQGNWNEAPRGSVLSVRLNARSSADGTPVHSLVSRATVGVSPEGIAISPDGRWVASTNLERSFLPEGDPRLTPFASISLLRLDAKNGTLSRVGDYAYDGILPEAAAFDASSRFLAVATFDHFAGCKRGGSVDFWRLTGDSLDPERVELVKTNLSIPVVRGAHSVILVK